MENNEQVLSCILDAGELLLTAGAEVGRVEDTMGRMAHAYGFVRTDVLTITASVIVTARHENGEVLTQTRRVTRRETDLARVDRLNALSREVCRAPLPAEELRSRIREIADAPDCAPWQRVAAYLLIAGSFTVFFGGTLRDSIAAMLCSLLLYALGRLGQRLMLQPIVLTIMQSAAMCFAAFVTVWCGLGQSVDKIVIGNIMLLIPGVALVTSLRDMIGGDTISGLLGACEALLRAIAIAAGCALVLMRFGGAA